MKDYWYADNRDIIKWSGMIHLCKEMRIQNVIQIAYFRKHTWPEMIIDNREQDFPKEVLMHFRNLHDVKRLGSEVGVNISVLDREFEHSHRDDYHGEICYQIQRQKGRKIVLLDPDIGLAPTIVKEKHVKPDEVSLIWEVLNPRDILVLYQHKFRDTDWINIRRRQMAKVRHVNHRMIGECLAPEVANDVVLFYCEKKM